LLGSPSDTFSCSVAVGFGRSASISWVKMWWTKLPEIQQDFYINWYKAWNRFYKPWSNFASWGVHLYSTFQNWGAVL
jgi:hypothetical protein